MLPYHFYIIRFFKNIKFCELTYASGGCRIEIDCIEQKFCEFSELNFNENRTLLLFETGYCEFCAPVFCSSFFCVIIGYRFREIIS